MGLFSLFGGKTKREAMAAAQPATRSAPAATPAPDAGAMQAAAPASEPVTPIAPAASGSGVAHVKLRLKLAASLRSGEHAEAYKAARDLAGMQTRAGRRVGARIWRAKAERILAESEVLAQADTVLDSA